MNLGPYRSSRFNGGPYRARASIDDRIMCERPHCLARVEHVYEGREICHSVVCKLWATKLALLALRRSRERKVSWFLFMLTFAFLAGFFYHAVIP